MKRNFNENQMRSLIKGVIKESLKDIEIEDLYTRFGNRNLHSGDGSAAMAAMGDDEEMANIAMNDKGVGEYNPYDEEGEFHDENWEVYEPDGGESTEEVPYKAAMEEGTIKLSESALWNVIRKTIAEQYYK